MENGEDPEIIQRMYYYPFGMPMQGNWTNTTQYQDRYTYNHKEQVTGIEWFAYGARYYDAKIGRFAGVDPLANDFAQLSTYSYVFNNPIRFIDPDGRAPDDIVAPNKGDRAKILSWINSKAAGSFRFDKQGKLYQYESGSYETGSEYYAEKLIAAIDDNNTITIEIQETVSVGGKLKSVDGEFGGGVTIVEGVSQVGPMAPGQAAREKDQRVVVSGNENKNIKDTQGRPLEDKPADILAHELVGHAIPKITKSDTGNAVENENKVRKEQPNGPHPLRAAEPAHKE